MEKMNFDLNAQIMNVAYWFVKKDLILKVDEDTNLNDDILVIKNFYKEKNIKEYIEKKVNLAKNNPKMAYIKYSIDRKEGNSIKGMFSNAALLFMLKNNLSRYDNYTESLFLNEFEKVFKDFCNNAMNENS